MDPELYDAVSSGDVTSFKNFISKNDDPNSLLKAETPQRNTILHVAASYSQDQIAQQIVHHHPSLLYSTNSDGDTPLHIAARIGCVEIVEHLLNCADDAGNREVELADQVFPTRRLNVADDTVLHDAVRNGHLEVVKRLILKVPGLALLPNKADESPLFLAVEKRFFPIAEYLLESAEQCSFKGRDGMNAFHAAILRCNGMVVNIDQQSIFKRIWNQLPFLSTKGMDIDEGFLGILKYMVRKCPTAIMEQDNSKRTPLHYAALLGCKEAVELFLTDKSVVIYKNDFVYNQDEEGMSAFLFAAKNGHVEVMRMLKRICPDISELLNLNAQTAFHVAVQGGNKDAVLYLLSTRWCEGVINKQDKDGNTTLHLAAILEDFPILFTLLKDNRIDGKVVNKHGLTAFDIIQSSMDLDEYVKRKLLLKLATMGGLPNLTGGVVGRKIGMQNTEQTNGGKTEKEELEKRKFGAVVKKNKSALFQIFNPSVIADASENDMLIATIIATITFAAAFQVPGGYESDGHYKGLPLFRNKSSFKSFIICDSLAFGLASVSIFLHFMASLNGKHSGTSHFVMQFALTSTFYSILAMVGAFISAVYLMDLKTAAYVCGCTFLVWYLYARFGRKVLAYLRSK